MSRPNRPIMYLYFTKKTFKILILFIYFLPSQVFHASAQGLEKRDLYTNRNTSPAPQAGGSITANGDLIRMNKCTTYSIDVLQNDLGLTSGVKSLKITADPKFGSAEFGEDNRLFYTPDLYYVGEDYLEYEVCNKNGDCGKAGVGIIVNDFDYHPEAIDDHISVQQGRYENVDVLANDLYLFDLDIHLEILSQPKYGSATVSNSQTVKLIVDEFFLGRDSLIYRVCDGDNDCDTGTLWITLSNEFDNSHTPQGFSPNGDGINDVFNIPVFDQFIPLKIMIMDRNGQLVYRSDSYNNQWDGKANTGFYNGEDLPAGIYYYKLTIPTISKEITGFVYLNR